MNGEKMVMVDNLKIILEKIEKLKKNDINEAATKEYLIRPFFETLGWDFSNPDEVVPEDNDTAGKRPDYSFYINGTRKVLIEAKPINNKLNDIKMINEKMSYCLNSQVPFLIITNGILYNVYYSELKGSGQEKLLFDLKLEGKIDEDLLNKLTKESFEKDDLLKYAQNTFILSNIKKTFEFLFEDPPRKFITLLNEKMKEIIGFTFGDNDIKNALQNIYIQINQDTNLYQNNNSQVNVVDSDQKQWTIDDQFNNGKWNNTFKLYKDLIKILQKEGLEFDEKPTKLYIGLLTKSNSKSFCQIHGQQKGLKILININFNDLTGQEKLNVRDVSKIGRWGTGETEAIINTVIDLNWCVNIIKKSYNSK
jgi:hypothetical protein